MMMYKLRPGKRHIICSTIAVLLAAHAYGGTYRCLSLTDLAVYNSKAVEKREVSSTTCCSITKHSGHAPNARILVVPVDATV